MSERTRIGICGGTFDPFHRGHREPIAAVRESLGWSQVLYVPAWVQPFKTGQALTSGYHRFAMTVLATCDDAWSEVSPWELERERVSYTVDTLEMLAAARPEATLEWSIGDDNLPALLAWKSLDRIFELANFIVLHRGEAAVPPELQWRVTAADGRGRAGHIVFAANRTVPVSATEIRRRLAAGEPVDAFVDPRVARYIQRHRLYS
jgi:nicotinate-nucleotide adenylyltransferase